LDAHGRREPLLEPAFSKRVPRSTPTADTAQKRAVAGATLHSQRSRRAAERRAGGQLVAGGQARLARSRAFEARRALARGLLKLGAGGDFPKCQK